MFGSKVRGINHIVVDAGKVHIVYGNRYIAPASSFRRRILFDILYFVQQDARKFRLQNMITGLLQFRIQCQRNIIACHGFNQIA